MKIAPPKLKESSKSAFTLLELLVVITIIGLLASMIFTGATGAIRKAEKMNAQNTAYNLKTSISAYFTEYRKYPVDADTDEQDELLTDEVLMDVLLGADSEADKGGLNPRKIVFFTGKTAKRGKKGPGDESDYRKGVRLERDGGGILVDPYYNFYRVVLDLDYNDRVETPDWDETSGTEVLPQTILIWSKGRENESDKDNIKTW